MISASSVGGSGIRPRISRPSTPRTGVGVERAFSGTGQDHTRDRVEHLPRSSARRRSEAPPASSRRRERSSRQLRQAATPTTFAAIRRGGTANYRRALITRPGGPASIRPAGTRHGVRLATPLTTTVGVRTSAHPCTRIDERTRHRHTRCSVDLRQETTQHPLSLAAPLCRSADLCRGVDGSRSGWTADTKTSSAGETSGSGFRRGLTPDTRHPVSRRTEPIEPRRPDVISTLMTWNARRRQQRLVARIRAVAAGGVVTARAWPPRWRRAPELALTAGVVSRAAGLSAALRRRCQAGGRTGAS